MACGAGVDGRADRLEDAEAGGDGVFLCAGADGLGEAAALGAAALEAGSGLDALDGAED